MIGTVIIWAVLILPLPLLGVAWTKARRPILALLILAGSAVLLVSSASRTVKLALLGPDYSNRLFISIGLNLATAIILGFISTIRRRSIGRRSIAAIAAFVLALGWLYMWAVNSVV
jgi:hypothetical protein